MKAFVSLLLVAVLHAGCTTLFSPQVCGADTDCHDGFICEPRDGQAICVRASEAPVLVGQSAPFTGSNQALGVGMKQGIQLAFDEQNAKGGIHGRELRLVARDDGYEPVRAESNARALVDAQASTRAPTCPNTASPVSNGAVPPQLVPVSTTAIGRGPDAVLALLGSVGTPTMVRAAPVAIESGTLFFGAFTGASALVRDGSAGPCARYIFNVRASYEQEARATMEYFLHRGISDYRALISFDQNDSFGAAGYAGLVAAYTDLQGAFPPSADHDTPIARFRYTRNDDTSVPTQATAAEAYLAGLLQSTSGNVRVGIMMTDTYGAAAGFIAHLRKWQFADDGQQASLGKATRLTLDFSNVSFVGPNALSDALIAAGTIQTPTGPMSLTQDVVVSQVVPNYESDLSDVVQQYNRLVDAAGLTPGFTSLEGYISTRVFIAGLLANQGALTVDNLVSTLENLPDLGLGLGANAGFSATNHQYSQSVWGTALHADGSFGNVYFWTSGSPIEFFQ